MASVQTLCWSCQGVTTPSLFCMICHVILPVAVDEDYFNLFAIQPTFDVDLIALEQHYRALQKKLHPDFFASRSARERRFSLERVTRLNEAWQTLSDPVARTEYLLQLAGWKAGTAATDPTFLMEVMELREALEEINIKAADAMARLDGLRDAAQARLKQEEEQVARLFHDHFDQQQGELLTNIARHCDRMRYHRRYLEELERMEDQAFE